MQIRLNQLVVASTMTSYIIEPTRLHGIDMYTVFEVDYAGRKTVLSNFFSERHAVTRVYTLVQQAKQQKGA